MEEQLISEQSQFRKAFLSSMKALFAFLFLAKVLAQCNGSCRNSTAEPCSSGYKAGLCPGPAGIECCPEMTASCPGMCQDKSLSCDGKYSSGLCPGSANVLCCIGVQPFADRNWDCADINCSSIVSTGSGQPNYECAEFVARSLAAGGHIPNLGAYASQSAYGNYNFGGVVYDLLWVSSKQGGPLGLGDCLLKMGWSNAGASAAAVKVASYVAVTGSNGPYSHTVVGVAGEVVDAHNVARYRVSVTGYTINAVYNPPAVLRNYTIEEAGPLPEDQRITRDRTRPPYFRSYPY